jgi:hypothetical protein
MAAYLALRDRRLSGGVPARPNLHIVNTSGTTPLGSAFASINSASRASGGLLAMFVMCHGYAGSNPRGRVCMDAGGMGLQLGRENVLHDNVALWTAIKGKVEHIVVYACAAANTESGNEGTRSDGRYLMGALAIHTEANVYAADRIQWYHTYKGMANGRFEFGQWEGQLLHFPPSGAAPTVVPFAPVEFADVMSGTAP